MTPLKEMTAQQREEFLFEQLKLCMAEKQSYGVLLATLRKQLLQMNQEEYGKLTGISRRTLSELERGANSPNLKVLAKAFKPFGLKPGLVPISVAQQEKIMSK